MYLEKFKLTGKIAVVTGAARGIGLAAAEAGGGAGDVQLGRDQCTLGQIGLDHGSRECARADEHHRGGGRGRDHALARGTVRHHDSRLLGGRFLCCLVD